MRNRRARPVSVRRITNLDRGASRTRKHCTLRCRIDDSRDGTCDRALDLFLVDEKDLLCLLFLRHSRLGLQSSEPDP